jgi:hypothetical protein
VAGVSGEEGGDVLLNAAAAAGMSIARFDDPAHQQVKIQNRRNMRLLVARNVRGLTVGIAAV